MLAGQRDAGMAASRVVDSDDSRVAKKVDSMVGEMAVPLAEQMAAQSVFLMAESLAE